MRSYIAKKKNICRRNHFLPRSQYYIRTFHHTLQKSHPIVFMVFFSSTKNQKHGNINWLGFDESFVLFLFLVFRELMS